MKFTIKPLLYSFITQLPFILFFSTVFKDYFYLDNLYVFTSIVLLFISTFVFRIYLLNKRESFLEEDSIQSEAIIFSFIGAALIFSFFIIQNKLIFPLIAFPLTLSLILNYNLNGLFYLKNGDSNEVNKVFNILIKKVIRVLLVYITLKTTAVLVLIFAKLWNSNLFYIAAISFVIDILLVIDLRKEQYCFYISQEIGFNYTVSKFKKLSKVLIIGLPLIISLVISRSWSLLSYKNINRFLKWLSLLGRRDSSSRQIREVAYENIFNTTGFMETSETSEFLDGIWKVGEKVILFFIIALVIYLVFSPIIKPLFNNKYKRVSLKDYYKSVYIKILNFFKSIKESFILIFSNENIRESSEIINIKKSLKERLKKQQADPMKLREVNKLLKFYVKTVKLVNKKVKKLDGVNFTVDELFEIIQLRDVTQRELLNSCSSIFKKGFYSDSRLTSCDFKNLKVNLDNVFKSL